MTRPVAVVPYVFRPPDERKQQMAGNERFLNRDPLVLYNQKLWSEIRSSEMNSIMDPRGRKRKQALIGTIEWAI